MTEPTVNIPLLRKAVEWAEAEAAKPYELCEWFQGDWVVTPGARKTHRAWLERKGQPIEGLAAKECGTCYCIAGYAAQVVDPHFADTDEVGDTTAREVAQEALGITDRQADQLFAGPNTITDVRRIAESIAGEAL